MGSTAKIIDNIPELLNQTGYFKELPSDVLNRLGGNAEVRQFGKGVILVHAGCLKDLNIYIVLEGQVHLTLPTLDSVRSLRFIDPGMTFGETTLLMLRSALYQSTATRKSRVLVISGSSWLREIESAPGMCKIVLKQLAQRLHDTTHMLLASSRKTDLSRVAGYFMDFQPDLESENFSFVLPARKLNIASSLGMSNASFSRALQRLKQAELIHVSGASIHVLKATQLNELASNLAS